MADKTLREQCERRLQAMKDERRPYETDWEEINRLGMSTRSVHLNGKRRNTRRGNVASNDSYARRAARTLAYGMQSGLSSSSMPWFKLKDIDPALMEDQEVKEFLDDTEKLIYEFFGDIGIYDPFKINYLELGNYGVGCSVMLEHLEYGASVHALTAGEYWIAADDAGRIDTMYRQVVYTVDQLVRTFPWENLSKVAQQAWKNNNLQMLVPCMHAVERNHDRDPIKFDQKNKLYRSIFWECGNDSKETLLRESGYDSKPFWAPRWETMGGSVYAENFPGMDALPDLREMQLSARRRGRGRDMLHKPPMKSPTGLMGGRIQLDPGRIIEGAATDLDGLRPALELPWQLLQASREDHEAIRQDVASCYYADLFNAISQREGVQPLNNLEAEFRNDEKFTQLGPIVDRVNVEMLEIAVQRAYVILENLGALPPVPKSMQGRPIVVDFVSMLAQAQQSARNGAIERIARFVGFLAGTFPDAVNKFDAEQAIDEFATGAGTPPRLIRSDEVVAQFKAEQQQQQQQQQAAALAPAAREGAQAAELLSRTQVGGGESALQQLVGQ